MWPLRKAELDGRPVLLETHGASGADTPEGAESPNTWLAVVGFLRGHMVLPEWVLSSGPSCGS
jgi:hypothetical protein